MRGVVCPYAAPHRPGKQNIGLGKTAIALYEAVAVFFVRKWKGHPQSVSAGMLSGLSLFLKTYAPELDDELFVKRMCVVDPGEIIRRGKLDFSTNRAALRYACVILEKYNRRQPEDRRLPYRFQV